MWMPPGRREEAEPCPSHLKKGHFHLLCTSGFQVSSEQSTPCFSEQFANPVRPRRPTLRRSQQTGAETPLPVQPVLGTCGLKA